MQRYAWAKEVWAGKSLAGDEVQDWLELNGYEVYDAVEENREDGRDLCAGLRTGFL